MINVNDLNSVLCRCNESVSIIVPVYNIEGFLAVCVDSLLAQTYRNLEIILVDDGSTDGSGALCDAYAARDGRVRVCHQHNKGLSGARNTGARIATGDWLVYVDGDDFVAPDFVEVLLGSAVATGAEVSCCLCLPVIADRSGAMSYKNVFNNKNWGAADFLSAGKAIAELLAEGRASTSACAKLARTSLWRALEFPEGRKYEDMPVTWKLFAASKGVIVLSNPRYGYVMRSSSITHVPTVASIIDYVTSIEQMYAETGADAVASRLVAQRSFRACLEYSRALDLLGQILASGQPDAARARVLYKKALAFIRAHVREALGSAESSRAQKARLLLTAVSPGFSSMLNAKLNRRKG